MNEERSADMKLDTTYLGLPLKHPIVASAGPISQTLDGIRRLEDGNAAAIVLSSLFEERIRSENELTEQRLSTGTDSFGESLSYFPDVAERAAGPEEYLNLVRNAVEVTDVPIIASLNGMTNEGWVDYARLLQDAGADALELNVYYIPADVETRGADVEQRYVEVLDAVKAEVTIPVAIKLGPYFSAFGSMARILVDAGADGLVLFNRFYQPDIDLDTLSITPSLDLSESNEIRLPLLWIGVLAGRVDASIAATSGVRTSEQVIKYLLAGADVVMTTSSLLRNGPRHMADLVRGLAQWMVDKGYDDVGQLRGAMSQRQVQDPAAFERANYIKVLQSY
ncbi:MAG: dihydroorotate dehydrogenase-like protein [Pseudomonadota bacterium]